LLITRVYAFVTRINITKRLLPLTNEAVIPRAMLACTRRGRVSRPSIRLSVVHERGFRPTYEVKTGTFGPRTTLC